jgi:hypothetical protein
LATYTVGAIGISRSKTPLNESILLAASVAGFAETILPTQKRLFAVTVRGGDAPAVAGGAGAANAAQSLVSAILIGGGYAFAIFGRAVPQRRAVF